MSTGDLTKFDLDGEEIEKVDQFTFLGALVTADGGCQSEIRRRLALGRSAMNGLRNIIHDKGVRTMTKMRLVNALVFPIVLYGCESWAMTKADRRRIDAFELWCWRRVLRISWTDRVTNKTVLTRASPKMSLKAMALKLKPLTIQTVWSMLKLSYFGHVLRANGMERDIMMGKVAGQRRRGRQRTRWLDGVTSAMGKSLGELKERMRCRVGWRRDIRWVTDGRNRLTG